jgi:protein-S-isoprenylcysteine O-methyltransferase Ste14
MLTILSLTGYLMMVAGLLLLILNKGLLSPSFVILVPQVAAVLLMIWARVTLGRRSFHATAGPTAGGLVTTGPYSLMRHPVYASVLLFVWAGILGNLTLTNIACGALAIGGVVLRTYCEESLLRLRYPEYDDYAKRTKRLVPFVL